MNIKINPEYNNHYADKSEKDYTNDIDQAQRLYDEVKCMLYAITTRAYYADNNELVRIYKQIDFYVRMVADSYKSLIYKQTLRDIAYPFDDYDKGTIYFYKDWDSKEDMEYDIDENKKFVNTYTKDLLVLASIKYIPRKDRNGWESQDEMEYLQSEYQDKISDIIQGIEEMMDDNARMKIGVDNWDYSKTNDEDGGEENDEKLEKDTNINTDDKPVKTEAVYSPQSYTEYNK